jgi:probable addiction module antidote protein
MTLETTIFDPAEHLSDPEGLDLLLEDAFGTGDPVYIANALGIVARARGISATARTAGVTREALHKAFSPQGNPRLTTLLGVTRALGYRLTLTPIDPETVPKSG